MSIIREYDYDAYLDLFSVVFQDFSLFAFPLGENIAGAKTFNAEKIEALSKKKYMRNNTLKNFPVVCIRKFF
ncbi:ABC-type siderophore export system fused ATPase/permease subunit [Treponema pedis]